MNGVPPIGGIAIRRARERRLHLHRLRLLASAEGNRDRARAGLIRAQVAIDIGTASGADMSEAVAMMDQLRARAAETEVALDEARLAAGLDHPDVAMTRAISQHLDAIGLDNINGNTE